MIYLIFLFGLALLPFESTAYVLLQVRRQNDNYSNVDALIHKVVPSSQFDKFAQRMAKKRSAVKERSAKTSIVNKIEPIIDDSDNQSSESTESEPELKDLLMAAAKKFARNSSGPIFRTKSQDIFIKPEKVHLRSGTSSVYNIDSDTIVVALKDFLSSSTLRKYLDNLTKKAAVVYRTVESEFLKKPDIFF